MRRVLTRLGRFVGRVAWVLLPWVAGVVAWWAVTWWLNPRPTWQIRFPSEGPILIPGGEDETGERLVAWEAQPVKDDAAGVPQALVVLDARNGKVLHRLNDVGSSQISTGGMTVPRFSGDALWRIVIVPGARRYELRAWQFATESQERLVQAWTHQPGELFRLMISPGRSGTLVTERALPWELSLGAMLTPAAVPIGPALAAHAFEADSEWWWGPSAPIVCQAWTLPRRPGQPLQEAGRWCLPALRTSAHPELSPDGQLVAYADGGVPKPWAGFAQWDTAESTGQAPAAKVRPLSAAPRGVLVYDVKTGSLLHRISPGQVDVQRVEWMGPYLKLDVSHAVVVRSPDDRTSYHSMPVREGGADAVHPLYHGRSGQRWRWPDGFRFQDPDAEMALHPDHPNFLVMMSRGAGEFSPPQELKMFALRSPFRNNMLAFVRNVDVPLVSAQLIQGWRLMETYVAISQADEATPDWLLDLARIHPTVENWVRSFWPAYSYRTALFDWADEELVWTRRGAVLAGDFRRLVLLGVQVDGASQRHYTFLESWDVPIATPSPWWSRGAGLGTVVLLLVVQWIRKWRQRRRLAWTAPGVNTPGSPSPPGVHTPGSPSPISVT